MIAKRVAAVAAAVALIAAAIVIRDRVIEGDGGAVEPEQPRQPAVLVCASELEVVCRAASDGLPVRPADAGATLADLAGDGTPTLWLTFDPFPAMVDSLRTTGGKAPLGFELEAVATSPIALVGAPELLETIGAECGTPVDWRCLAGLGIDVGFARTPDSGLGLLAVTQASLGYGAAGIPADDALFQVWLRDLVRSVPASRLSGVTAVATIQNRPSAMDVAAGAEAQLSDARRSSFGVAYADPMMRADVVLAIPPGLSVPDGLVDRLTAALTGAGWAAGGGAGPAVDAATALAVRSLWGELS